MRKEIIHTLPYREDGERKEKRIKISFISYRMLREYSENQLIALRANAAHNRMVLIEEEMAIASREKLDGYKDVIKKFNIEHKECLDVILEFNDNNFFSDRFELIKRILTDNGYKNDLILMDDDFWDSKVDPYDFADFLDKAINKDSNDKKKITQSQK